MDSRKEEKHLECNICCQSPKEAVVSLCGHLFCWPCLYTWLHFYTPSQQTHQCPVCNSPIHHHDLIPLYATSSPISISVSGIHIPTRPRPVTSPSSSPRRQLVFRARHVSRLIDNLIMVLLYGLLLPALLVLFFKAWTREARNSNGFGYNELVYKHKHETSDHSNHHVHVIREGLLLQSSSCPLQYCLSLLVISTFLAIDFAAAG